MVAVRIYSDHLQFGKDSVWITVDTIANCVSGLLLQDRAYITTIDGLNLNAVCDLTQSRWVVSGTSLIEQRYVVSHPEAIPIAVFSDSSSDSAVEDYLDLIAPIERMVQKVQRQTLKYTEAIESYGN